MTTGETGSTTDGSCLPRRCRALFPNLGVFLETPDGGSTGPYYQLPDGGFERWDFVRLSLSEGRAVASAMPRIDAWQARRRNRFKLSIVVLPEAESGFRVLAVPESENGPLRGGTTILVDRDFNVAGEEEGARASAE